MTAIRPTASASSDIRVRRIYAPAAEEDGFRILVDRLWPRGVSKARAALDLWCKEVAPSTGLRQWFGHAPDRWSAFRERYRVELQGNDAGLALLRDFVRRGTVTLLFAARDEQRNEAVVLREVLLDAPDGAPRRERAAAKGSGVPPRSTHDPRTRTHQ